MSKKVPQILKSLSLQGFLSPERLRHLAGAKVYARGHKYHEDGCVALLYHMVSHAAAEVKGSQIYRVELTLTDKGLESGCTCPAMKDFGFCKHAVALGLYLIDAPPPSGKDIARKGKSETDSFAKQYPNITGWVQDGWIEIGRDGYSTSLVRVMDRGGLVWEGGTRHKSMDKVLQEADQMIAKYCGD